jgi:hypothetical protein
MLNKIISAIVVIGVGATLLPEIVNQVGHSAYYYKEEEKIEKPHKQTYLEYVKERLEVERLMR